MNYKDGCFNIDSMEQSMMYVLGCDLIGLVVKTIDKCSGEIVIQSTEYKIDVKKEFLNNFIIINISFIFFKP